MKPPPFQYHDPKTLTEAVGLLGQLDNAKLLAGGQSLMPMLNMRFVLPDHIIDLNQVEGLAFIRESNGTLDGSLCHLDPSAELVSVATALDATVVVQGPGGTREIPFSAFPVAYMTPAIEPNEIVTAARFPLWPQPHGYGFVEFARRHGDFAIVSAAALITEDGAGKITRASVTLGGMGAAPSRASEVEQALIGNRPDDKLLREICESCRAFEAVDDVHAPAAYRQQLATVMSRRALEQARSRLPSMAKTH